MAIWKKALFPFQILFATAVMLRKKLYATGVISRYVAPIPTIVVGNLATGGTGKNAYGRLLATPVLSKKGIGRVEPWLWTQVQRIFWLFVQLPLLLMLVMSR
jgi:tetraacyldisaccharide-1-P 4'-kinase